MSVPGKMIRVLGICRGLHACGGAAPSAHSFAPLLSLRLVWVAQPENGCIMIITEFMEHGARPCCTAAVRLAMQQVQYLQGQSATPLGCGWAAAPLPGGLSAVPADRQVLPRSITSCYLLVLRALNTRRCAE